MTEHILQPFPQNSDPVIAVFLTIHVTVPDLLTVHELKKVPG
jgi:hypothetical protein